jgi:hypothetical protein
MLVILFTACRKDALVVAPVNDPSTANMFGQSADLKLSLLSIAPADRDTAVDMNSPITIFCNREGAKMSGVSFVLRHGSAEVNGKLEIKDNSVVFTPEVNLKPNTVYNFQFKATVRSTSLNRENPVTLTPIEENWSFTTMGWPQYLMERTSQTVTDFARDGAKMIQVGDYLYFYGGWKGFEYYSESFNDIYRSSGDLSVWEKLPEAPWEGRHTFGLGKIDSTVYVYGGDQNSTVFDVWKSGDGENFSEVTPDLGSTIGERVLYGACTHNNKLFIMGGQRGTDDEFEGLDDVWTSDDGREWKMIATGLDFLAKNISGGVASFNNKIWVVGGGYYQDSEPGERWTNRIYSSPDGINWKQEPDAPWIGRQYGDVCVWDNKLWVIGGNDGKNLNEIWYMNRDGSWVQYEPSNLFTARHASAVAVYNDQLVIACGDQSNECWVIKR